MTALIEHAAWQALEAHAESMRGRHLRELFAGDTERFQRFSLIHDDLLLDLSKNAITQETRSLLLDLARALDLDAFRRDLFAGEAVNWTEGRAALHMALRAPEDAGYRVAGADVMAVVEATRRRMAGLVERVQGGDWRGATGDTITDVVNIGIGGSDLGPAMATAALKPHHHEGIRAHFVSNVDGAEISEVLAALDPATTLFLVASKTFATQETMVNAATARAWLVAALGENAVANHFIALSTNRDAVIAFGIIEANMLPFWDWVGGRYSLWSAIGLSIAMQVSWQTYADLLAGAHEMDEHFRSAPWSENLPAMLALVGIWNRNFMGTGAHAILPYDRRLSRLPAFLQQLEMESNGKAIDRDGRRVGHATQPVILGEPGTNGQHAFYQALHQGTEVVSADFLCAAEPDHDLGHHHDLLLANALAQSQALMLGRDEDEARAALQADDLDEAAQAALLPHKVFPGNRPSSTLLYRRLDARTLGRLIALYEHKVAVQGHIWGVNSFDQWGVELGKVLAGDVLAALGDGVGDFDASTAGLLAHMRALKGGGS